MYQTHAGDDSSVELLPHRVRWALVLAFWGLFWLLFTLIRVAFTHWVARDVQYPPPIYMAVVDALQLGQWALLTPAIFWLSGRLRVSRSNWHRVALAHIAIGVALVVLTSLVTLAGHNILLPAASHPWTLEVVGGMLLSYNAPLFLILYAGVVGTGFALHYYRSMQREQLAAAHLTTQLVEAQLQALRMQLHPHFLFNTLNTISQLTEHDPASARRAITRLGGLLRRALASTHEQEVTLADELCFVEDYLELAKVRLGERLQVAMHIAPEAREGLVPTLMLQPLVENAIEHGVARFPGPGYVTMEATLDDGVLRIRMRNSGLGLRGNPSDEGVGLSNTRSRLERLHGEDAGLTLSEKDTGEVVTEIRLPFRTHADLRVGLVAERQA